ncbi:MAG: hypothetical protein PHO53_05725, partial [Actinomycetota bacterium]|nr:hypothetical protein [Actinomycetota bacterium]
MTSKGKKKAKRKSSYAKAGKAPVEREGSANQVGAGKAPVESGGARAEKAKAGEAQKKEQWNLIKAGTPELRIFLILLVFLVVGVFLQYALAADSHVLEYQR